MKELIEEFPDQLRESFAIAKAFQFSIPNKPISQLVFCGMGGSGIGAMVVSKWIETELKVPVTLIQDYVIPAWVNENSLIIASSYSGNTEETIAAMGACKERGAEIVGITSGGKLEALCNENGYNVIIVPGGLPPRAALGYSIVQLLRTIEAYGLISKNVFAKLEKCADHLEANSAEIHAIAHKIVTAVNDTNAVIYAEAPYEAVAIRGKQQLNENGKFLCRVHTLPEMNHNELLGWGSGTQQHSAIFLSTSDVIAPNRRRMELTSEIIREKTDRVLIIDAVGENAIEQSMYLINILDWASYYLGIERGEDVVEIRMIDYLKTELAKQ